jgi:protein O-GlcNAc transferase
MFNRARLYFLSLSVLCCVWLTPACEELRAQASGIPALHQEAGEAAKRKDYATAARLYEQILKVDPSLHEVRSNLGMMYYLDRKVPQAVTVFQKVLESNPRLFVPRLFLGICLLEQDRAAQALPHLEQAVKAKPLDAPARRQLARAFHLLGRYDEALPQLMKLRELEPADPETLYLLGQVHLKLSLAAHEKLKRQDPENYRVYQLLGENYEIQGLNGPALVNYRKALERNPRAPGISVKVGDLLMAAGEAAAAVEAYRRETETNPGSALGHYKLGSALLDQGRAAEACGILKSAVELDETAVAPRVAFGRCLLEQNRLQEAISQLKRAVELDAKFAPAYFQLARAHQSAGDAAAAQSAMENYEKHRNQP